MGFRVIYLFFYIQKKRRKYKSCKLLKAFPDNNVCNNELLMTSLIISATHGHFELHGSKKKVFFNEEHQPIFLLVIYIYIFFYFLFFLKRKALKSTLNRDNSCDSSQKIYADLDWQLYIWGRYDLVLMLSLATLLMRPRSILAGRLAAGRHGQSWKVGKWLRLHNCDWLQPRGTTFSDFTHPGGAAEL